MLIQSDEQKLRSFFTGMVEQVFFSDVGICVPMLTDYLSGLLVEFVHMDAICRPEATTSPQLAAWSQMRADAVLGVNSDQCARERVTHKYIGDFTLFWAGMYPETLRKRRQLGVDRLHEYRLRGKFEYDVASRLSRPGDVPPADLLRDLSEQFDSCAHGLRLVRQSWEQLVTTLRRN